MMRRTGGFGCGCAARPGFGGIGTLLADVAGSFVGDPAAGNQVAAFSPAAFGPITQSAQQIGAGVAPAVAAALQAQGYVFPPGTNGAALTNPSIFDAFGGQNRSLVEAATAGVGLLLLVKLLHR